MRNDKEVKEIIKERKKFGYEILISDTFSPVVSQIAKDCNINNENFKGVTILEAFDVIASASYCLKTEEECKNMLTFIDKLKDFIDSISAFMKIDFIVDAIKMRISEKLYQIYDTERAESTLQNKIVDKFDKYFPDYEFIKREYTLKDRTRIDILAKDKTSERYVIIELKSPNVKANVNPQLLHYGSFFNNPILVGINHTGEKLKNAIYLEIK